MTAKRHFLPKGIDQQGRHPQAAEAATEVGLDTDLSCACGIVNWTIATLAVWLVVAIALCAAMWP